MSKLSVVVVLCSFAALHGCGGKPTVATSTDESPTTFAGRVARNADYIGIKTHVKETKVVNEVLETTYRTTIYRTNDVTSSLEDYCRKNGGFIQRYIDTFCVELSNNQPIFGYRMTYTGKGTRKKRGINDQGCSVLSCYGV